MGGGGGGGGMVFMECTCPAITSASIPWWERGEGEFLLLEGGGGGVNSNSFTSEVVCQSFSLLHLQECIICVVLP